MVRPSQLRVEDTPVTHPIVGRLVEAVQEEYVVRYGSRDDTPLDLEEFAGDRGVFLVGWLEGHPVATGAWRWHDLVAGVQRGPCTEIKRMYVAASHRGRGLGRDMLRALEQRASRAAAATMILETGMRQPEAIALYGTAGYTPIPDFGHYAGHALSRCFAKRLPPWAGNPELRDALAVHLEPVLDALGVNFAFHSSSRDENSPEVPTDTVLYQASPRRWAERFPAGPVDVESHCIALWLHVPRAAGERIRVDWELGDADPGLVATGDPDRDVEAVALALEGYFVSEP